MHFTALALAACSTPTPTGSSDLDTGMWAPAEASTAVDPTWTPEQALDQLQASLDDGLPQPWVARDAFLGLIDEGQDASCPGTTDFDGSKPLGCTSESGYLYAGISSYIEDPNGWALGGDFEIREPDGSAFHGAGHIFVHGNEYGQMTEFSGSWTHDGGDDWLAEGRSGVFTATSSNGRTDLDGGLDLDGTSIHFADVVLEEHGPERLSGTIGVRDDAGAWWWLELGGDGCGDLTFGTDPMGSGCVELERPIDDWTSGLLR